MPRKSEKEFTWGVVSKFKFSGKARAEYIWDAKVPGLGIRVTAGSKSYIFQRRSGEPEERNGKMYYKTFYKTLGSCNPNIMSLKKARQEATKLNVLVDGGIDPGAREKEERAARARVGLAVSTAWQDYLDTQKGQWSDRHLADHGYLERGVLAPLLEKKMTEIDLKALVAWAENAIAADKARLAEIETNRARAADLDAIAQAASDRAVGARSPKGRRKAKEKARQAKAEAGQLRKTLSNNKGHLTALRQGYVRFRAFWRWSSGRPDDYGGLADPKMFTHSDLTRLIPAQRAKSDVLERSQLEAWFSAVQRIENPVIAAFLQSLLLTGARRGELAALRWEDVDFQWKNIQLHDKVEADGRTIPLTPYLEFLISRLPRRNEWVFSSPQAKKKGGQIAEPRIQHKRALKEAGLPEDLTLHGLRRSFISLSEWIEAPAGVIAQICGHKPSAIQEKHYRRRPLDLLALWHGKLEAWILEQAIVEFDPEAARDGLRVVN